MEDQELEAPQAEPELPTTTPFYRYINLEIIGMALAIKALVFLAGWAAFQLMQDKRPASWYALIEMWHRWDSMRYFRIADKWYGATGDVSDLVGFPLFPMLSRALSFITGDALISGFLVAGIASVAAAVVLYQLVRMDNGENVARNSAWFLLIFPTSYFLHINYTEGLFIALAIGSLLLARKGNWKIAALLGFLTCMTRLNGLVLVPVLMIEAYLQYRKEQKLRLEWAMIALVPLGFAVHMLLNNIAVGDPLAFLAIGGTHYNKAFSAPWSGILGTYDRIWSQNPASGLTNGFFELFFIMLGLVCTVISAFWLRASYTVWMALNWFLYTSTDFLLSVPRYTLTLFPIFIIFAKLAERSIWYTILTVWSLLFLGIFLARFVHGHWAFG